MSDIEQQRVDYQAADEGAQKQGGQRVYGPTASADVPARAEGYRRAPIRESRIKDRPYTPMNDNLSIKIELDLEVEVDLYGMHLSLLILRLRRPAELLRRLFEAVLSVVFSSSRSTPKSPKSFQNQC